MNRREVIIGGVTLLAVTALPDVVAGLSRKSDEIESFRSAWFTFADGVTLPGRWISGGAHSSMFHVGETYRKDLEAEAARAGERGFVHTPYGGYHYVRKMPSLIALDKNLCCDNGWYGIPRRYKTRVVGGRPQPDEYGVVVIDMFEPLSSGAAFRRSLARHRLPPDGVSRT